MLRKAQLLVFFFMVFIRLINAQTLDYYLTKAIEKSPFLTELNNQKLSGQLDSLIIIAANKPQVNLSSQLMYAPVGNHYGYDEAISNGGNYASLLNMEKPLFNKKIREGQFNEIKLAGKSIEANIKITQTQLKQDVTSQYLTTYSDFVQLQFSKGIIDLLKEEQQVVKHLVDKGIYLQTDQMNLSLSITNQQVIIHEAIIHYKNDIAILNLLCGINDTSTVILGRPELTPRGSFEICNSPTMIKYKVDSLRLINAKYLIDLNYRPRISAFANAGFQSVTPENIAGNFGASLGFNLTLPVIDGHQRKIQYNKTAIEEQTLVKYKEFYTSQFWQQLNQMKQQLKLTEELILKIKLQLSEQEKLIELYKIEIEKGLVRFIDFLNIINNYNAAKVNLSLSEMDRLQIINKMNYLK